jgi:nucleoside-diphosphate-sugar epimerase
MPAPSRTPTPHARCFPGRPPPSWQSSAPTVPGAVVGGLGFIVPRARELLGFEAQVALEDGLPELAEWVARQA